MFGSYKIFGKLRLKMLCVFCRHQQPLQHTFLRTHNCMVQQPVLCTVPQRCTSTNIIRIYRNREKFKCRCRCRCKISNNLVGCSCNNNSRGLLSMFCLESFLVDVEEMLRLFYTDAKVGNQTWCFNDNNQIKIKTRKLQANIEKNCNLINCLKFFV